MNSLSGVLLALLGVALISRLAEGGWSGTGGVADWLRAKFLGKPVGAA
jgi:hypothetical protein